MKNNPAFLAALFGMCLAVPAHSGVVGVDVNGTASSAGVLDPEVRTWKAIGTSFALDSMTVNSSVSASSLGAIGSPGLPIFANYRHNGASGAITVTLTGLDDSQAYNLAVMMGQAFTPLRGGTATVTTAGATNPPAGSTAPTDLSIFAEGDNHVLFEGLTTGTTPGQITFTVTNGPHGIGILNGFEIQNVDPAAPGIRVPDSVTASCHGEPTWLTVTVNNTAGIAYHVTGTSYSGPDAARFSDTTITPLEIPAGGSAEVYVDFTPSTGGTANATLTLATDDPGAPVIEVPLAVEVHDPAVVAATSLAFGSFIVPPGPTPAMIDVENLGFTSELTLDNPQITGTGAAAFSVTNLPASIEAGGFEQIEVTFNPAVPGIYQAQLSLDTNDSYNPTLTIDLSGMVSGGGTPKMQWGFDFTSGTVQSNGGTVNDDTGSSNPGLLLAPGSGAGGSYTTDIPAAGTAVGQARNVTGIGSLDITGPGGVSTGSGAFTGQALNGLSAAAVEAAGGLTYEIWVKNATSTTALGNLIGLGGMYGLGVRPNLGIGFYYGDNGEFLAPATPIDTTEWTHVAAVMVVRPGTGAQQFSKITLYANGRRVAEDADGRTFPWFLERGAGIGIHPVLGGDDADGLLYEPRISAGTLTPSEFTVVPPPAGIFAPDEIAGTTTGSPLGLTIEVENTDTTGRTLTEPTFSGPDAAFFTVAGFPATLTPGERSPVLVDFDAVASGGGTFTATMTLHSDDPNRPAYEVALTVEVLLGYTSWADQWVDGQAADLDHDHDGVANGVEYFMGNTTPGFTANPPIGSDRTISWPKGASYTGTYGTDYHLETSATLDVWEPVDEADVAIDADSIGFTVPLDGPRRFVRLVVTGP